MMTLSHARKDGGRMAGSRRVLSFVPVALSLFLAACNSGNRLHQPAVDPVQEQITILQKQLLELQNVQNETRRSVETQASRTSEINARITSLEARSASAPAAPAATAQKPSSAASPAKAPSKKPAAKQPPKKKKKPARRMEP